MYLSYVTFSLVPSSILCRNRDSRVCIVDRVQEAGHGCSSAHPQVAVFPEECPRGLLFHTGMIELQFVYLLI